MIYQEIEDEPLAIAEKADFIRMYMIYYEKIYNYVYFRIRDKETTEDLVGDIFLKLYENRMKYDMTKARLSTWIFTVAHNHVADYYKKKKNSGQIDLALLEADTADEEDIEELVFGKISREYAVQALRKLKAKERKVIYLKYFKNFSYREIAEHMNITEKNASVFLSRSIKKLKKIFEELYSKR